MCSEIDAEVTVVSPEALCTEVRQVLEAKLARHA
jgi:hypothetical protein